MTNIKKSILVGITHSTKNIETRPIWKPMHLQPVFKKYPSYTNGVSTNLFDRGLCLPSGSNLSIEDKTRIVQIILDIINK